MLKFHMTPLAAAVLAAYAVPALSQEVSAVEKSKADDDVVQLPSVQVRGEAESPYKVEPQSNKYTAPLRDTPKSVTVIPATVLRDNAATSLQDALRTVPGISFMAGEGGTAIGDRPTIRGLSSGNSIFIDGIRDIGTQTRDVFALESVEVSKGADSAFGGRGSGGGSINLVTKQAKAGDDAAASIMLGSSDTVRGTLDKNWQINDTSAARLNVMGNKGTVPGRDDAVDFDKWGVSGALAFGMGTPTRINADYYHLTDNGMPDYSIPYDLADGRPVTETMGVDRENFYGLVNRDFRKADTDIGTISIAHDLEGGFVLRNVTRYGVSTNSYVVTNPDDSRGNVASGWVNRSTKTRWSETESFANTTAISGKFETGVLKHSFSGGLEVSREKRDQDGYTVFDPAAAGATPTAIGATRNCSTNTAQQDDSGTPGNAGTGNCTSLFNPNPNYAWAGSVKRTNATTHFTTDSTGIYAFDTIEFSPQWLANLGVRWDDYETEAKRAAGTNVAGTAVSALSAQSTDTFFNYQAGLIFKPVEIGSVYASYSTESTPVTVTGGDEDAVTVANQALKPEESKTAEIGTKWELFHDRLLLTAAVFNTERKNAQIQIDATTSQQVGKTRVRGAELSFSGNVTQEWQVFGGYSYLDSELVRGTLYVAPPTQPTPPTGGSASAVTEVLTTSQGQQLPNTPEHSFSLFTTYRVLPKLSVGGGAYYVSKVFGSTQHSRTTTTTTTAAGVTTTTPVDNVPKYVPDYWRFDATASYDFTKNVNVQVNVQNLTDETYYTKAFTTHYAQLGPGRQYLVSLNMAF